MKNLYSSLPVFKSSQILLTSVFKKISGLSREYKYSLGENIKKIAFELLLEIYRANRNKSEKIKHLDLAKDHIEYIRLSFRLLKDLKCISVKSFAHISLAISDVSKQLNAWVKFEIQLKNIN